MNNCGTGAEKVCSFVSARFFAYALNDKENFGLFHIVMLSMQSGATSLQGVRSVCIHVATPLKKAKPQVSMRKHSSCE